MRTATKIAKINSLSLAKAATQFLAKIEFDLQPLIQDKALSESLQKINTAITKLEIMSEELAKASDRTDTVELSSDFQKTDKALEKIKEKINHLQTALDTIAETFEKKLIAKFEILRTTDPKDADDTTHRKTIETHIASIKTLLGIAKTNLHKVQTPAETALKRMHAIKPQLYALGIPDNFDRCQKRAEKLNEEITALCHATTEISISAEVAAKTVLLFKGAEPMKVFLPKLRTELEKSSTLLHQTDMHLQRLFPLGNNQENTRNPSVTLHVETNAILGTSSSIGTSTTSRAGVSMNTRSSPTESGLAANGENAAAPTTVPTTGAGTNTTTNTTTTRTSDRLVA